MRLAPILLLAALLGACASPYRADLAVDGKAQLSTDARYFLVDAEGAASVAAVDKATGAVLWSYALPAGTHKAWLRSGKSFREVTRAEAAAALGMVTP